MLALTSGDQRLENALHVCETLCYEANTLVARYSRNFKDDFLPVV